MTRDQFRAVALLVVLTLCLTFWVIVTATAQHFL